MPKGPLGQWPQTDQDGGYPHNLPIGGIVYNATPPAPADGQAVALQGDSAGNLKVAVAGGSISGTVTANQGTAGSSPWPISTGLDTDPYGRLITPSLSPLGADLVAFAYNQLEMNFSIAFDANLITNTHINSAPAPSQANGQATYATGTNAAGEGKGVSVQALEYRPGHTWYSLFTVVFATPAASSYQRIGPYNSTDGFWIGYEGTTFGLTRFLAGAATQTAKASWNGDPLDGSAGSKFTSNGSPVAWNPQKGNIYRFQGSWFGFAPVQLDILSPDGTWVTAHTFRNPNTLTSPYATTTNWNMTIDVANTGNTSNISMSTACWAMGTHDQNTAVSDVINDQTLATQVRAVLCGKSPTGAYANVLTDGAGDLTVAVENMPAVCYIGQTGDAGSQLEITTHVHAAPPTYADNTMQPPTLDTAGNLRVVTNFAKDNARFSVAQVNITASGTVIAGSGSTVIRIYRMILIVGGTTAGTVAIGDTTPTTLFPASPFLPYSSFSFDLDGEPYITTTAGAGLVFTLLGITAITGCLWFTQT